MNGKRDLSDFTLLITDDDSISRMILRIKLRELEMPVEEASNGNQALEIIHRLNGRPIVQLLDLNMPELDGYDLINFMQATPEKYGHVKTIVLSGSPSGAFYAEKIGEYISAYAEKPIDAKDIISKIREAVKQ